MYSTKIKTIAMTFPPPCEHYEKQSNLISSLETQISNKFPNQSSVLINMTWFGPQFTDNNAYAEFIEYSQSCSIDNIFLLATEDPCFFNREETLKFIKDSGADNYYLMGNFDQGLHNFNFYATTLLENSPDYTEQQLILKEPKHIFLNYNRKPRIHRTEFVNMLDQLDLSPCGVVTLGNNRNVGDTIEQYAKGNWNMADDYGIPHDISSIGRLDIWQNHFLTITSETDFEDHLYTFVSEKSWKPIMGMRPFLINGQLAVYEYLRNYGFKTFNHYWPHIEIETCNIDDIHKNICAVIRFLQTQDLEQMYLDMLPDLRYNRLRFNEFVTEQNHKMENIFDV